MKEDIKRILKLVEDGRISPEDASELIEALTASEYHEHGQEGQDKSAGSHCTSASSESSTEPSADGSAGEKSEATAGKDPFKALIDVIESFGKEASQAIDFKMLSDKLKSSTKDGGKAIADAWKTASEHGFTFGLIETRKISMPIFVPEGKTLNVENQCGQIEVCGESSENVVYATLRVRGGSESDRKARAEQYVLSIEETDHEVIVKQGYSPNIQLDLKISVSGRPSAILKSDSSDISGEHLQSCTMESRSGNCAATDCSGHADLKSISGDISLNGVKDRCALETRSGNVSLTNAEGAASARSTSGDVAVNGFSGGSASIESLSGNVSADEFGPVTGAVNIRTVSGDVQLTLKDGSDCALAISTVSGDFKCDVGATDVHESDRRLTGKLGSGAGTLDVSSVSGDISVSLLAHQAAG